MKWRKFHREAEEEYSASATYYSNIDPELARRFYDEIERLILEVRNNPGRFRLFEHPVRGHFWDVFPYAVLFVNQPEMVVIVAIMQMKPRPGYWKTRLEWRQIFLSFTFIRDTLISRGSFALGIVNVPCQRWFLSPKNTLF